MSDGGSQDGTFRADPPSRPPAPAARPRSRRRLVALIAFALVALVAGGAIVRSYLADRPNDAASASDWRRMVLPASTAQPESARLDTIVAPVSAGGIWRAVGSVLDTRSGRNAATAWSSPDGQTWARSTIEAAQDSVAAGVVAQEGSVVAVGTVLGPHDRDGAIWVSPDGRDWQRINLPELEGAGDQDLRFVVGGAFGLVATGRERGPESSTLTMFHSADGTSWARLGADVFGQPSDLDGLAVGPAGAVAVGWRQDGARVYPAVWSSPDGLTWSRARLGAGDAMGVATAVTWTNNGFVVATQEGEGADRVPVLWRSSDGAEWARMGTPPVMTELAGQRSSGGVALRALGGQSPLVAVGGGFTNQLWRSEDGLDWSRDEAPAHLAVGIGSLRFVAAHGDTVLVAANRGTGADLWLQRGEQEWSAVADPSVFPVSAPLSTDADLLRTPSGLTLFAARPDESEPGRFGGTAVWTSRDGRSWQAQPDEAGHLRHASLGDATSWTGGFVVVGDLEDERGDRFVRAMAWTSTDGASWQRVPDQPGWAVPGTTRFLTSVAQVSAGLVAVGTSFGVEDRDTHLWTSADARAWTQVPDEEAWSGPGDQALVALCRLPGDGLVALGYSGAGSDYEAWAWTSADGGVWFRASGEGAAPLGGAGSRTARECVSTPGGVVAAGREDAVAGGDAVLWSSQDGQTWSRRGDAALLGGQGEQTVTAMAVEGPKVVAVGYDDDRAAVWYSVDEGRTWGRIPDDHSLFGGFSAYRASGVAVLDDRIVVSGIGPGGVVIWEGPLP